MALFRTFFYRKPPEGLLEIAEGLYVFDCCFTEAVAKGHDYEAYIGGIVAQLKDYLRDASFMVFNFRGGENQSQISDILSKYDMIVIDYPHHYEGCPLLTVERIHHFLRSSESWLSLGQQNVLLMHCEKGGWPVLAFVLAALLIYSKQYTGELKTLEMIYKQSPRELMQLISLLNPLPSQLRYLYYISRRHAGSEWPPFERPLTLDCVILRVLPNFDGKGGCQPIFQIYGQDPFIATDQRPKVLFSTPKQSNCVRFYKQAGCQLVKVDIHCHIQGDVVVECINLGEDESEEIIFRTMFNTAFIRSNILVLDRDEIDILWNARDRFPKDFRAEVLFADMDSATSAITPEIAACEGTGLPVEAFSKVQEIFSDVDWLNTRGDAASQVVQQISLPTPIDVKIDTTSKPSFGVSVGCGSEKTMEKDQSGRILGAKNDERTLLSLPMRQSSKGFPDQRASKEPFSQQNFLLTSQTMQPKRTPKLDREFSRSMSTSLSRKPKSLHSSVSRYHSAPPSLGITSLQDHGGYQKIKPICAKETPAPFLSLPLCAPLMSSDITGSNNQSLKLPVAPLTPKVSPCPSGHSTSVPTSLVPPVPKPPPLLEIPCTKSHVLDLVVSSSYQVISSSARIDTDSSSNFSLLPSVKHCPSLCAELPYPSIHSNVSLPPPPLPAQLSPPSPPPPPPQPQLSQLSPPPPPPKLPSPQLPPPPPPPPCPPSSRKPEDRASSPVPPPLPPRSALSEPSTAPFPPPPPSFTPSQCGNTASQKSPFAPPVPPPPLLQGSKGGKGNGVPLFFTHSPSPRQSAPKRTTLRPLHWVKVTRAVQGSLWAEPQKQDDASKVAVFDMSELESLFSAAVPSVDARSSGEDSSKKAKWKQKSERVHLVDLRRANNCEIMLTKVKMPLPDLISSVLALDDTILDVDQVDNIVKFCPTKEEMELLKDFKGNIQTLGKCEQFFVELMKVPRVESKLRVFSFKIQFCSQVVELRNGLNVVNSASEEIRNSDKLKRIMQSILSLGNALNQGTARGSAVGFKLDSLLKLTDTRSRNSRMTLMHYLCKVLAENLPELLEFPKDLISLEAASKIQLKFLTEEMQAISKGLEKVEKELTASKNDSPISETFCKTLMEFLASAEADVRALTSLYSGVGRNADALALYFGEDPARCPFEQVVSTLLNFVRMFVSAHEENCKQLEIARKKAQKEAANEKMKLHSPRTPRTPRKGQD